MSQFIRLAVPRQQKAKAESIVLNATSAPLTVNHRGLFIKPIRDHGAPLPKSLYYDTESGEIFHAHTSGVLNVDEYWSPYPTDPDHTLTLSGEWSNLRLGQTTIYGSSGNSVTLDFNGFTENGSFDLFDGSHNWHFGYSGGVSPAYMIDGKVVADHTGYQNIIGNNVKISDVSARVYTLEGMDHHVNELWKIADGAPDTLTPSGDVVTNLKLGGATIKGAYVNEVGATLTFDASQYPLMGGAFQLHQNDTENTWHFGYSGHMESDPPAYLINGDVVATRERHTQISVNEVRIDALAAAALWQLDPTDIDTDPPHMHILEPSTTNSTTSNVDSIKPNSKGDVHWTIMAPSTAVWDGGRIQLGMHPATPDAQIQLIATPPYNAPGHQHSWHVGVSGEKDQGTWVGIPSPGYFIDHRLVADVSSYIMIGDNSTNIWLLSGDVSDNTTCCLDNSQNIWKLTGDVSDNSYNIFLLSGDVSNNTTCCLDNSQNIWKLTGDVSDNSYNIFLLSGDVSNNTTCCLDNSQNIWKLTGDISDNSYNIFLLSGDVSNNTTCCLDNSQNIWKLTGDVSDNSYNIFRLSGEVWAGGGVHWVKGPASTLAAKSPNVSTLEFGGGKFKMVMGLDGSGTFSAGYGNNAAGTGASIYGNEGNVAIGYNCECDGSGGGQVALGRFAKTSGKPGDGSGGNLFGVSTYVPFVFTDGSGAGEGAGGSFGFGYDGSGPVILAKHGDTGMWYPLAGTNLSISGDMQNMWVAPSTTIYPSANVLNFVDTLKLQDPANTTNSNAGSLIMDGCLSCPGGGGRSANLTIAPGAGTAPGAMGAVLPSWSGGVSGAAMLVEMWGDGGSCPSGTYFTFGGKHDGVPAIFINNSVVADVSSYIMIGDNSINIWSISGDVSDNTTCCLDNSKNIWQLTLDVSDNSNNIWNLTGDVSDNSYNIFLLSGDVSNNTTCCLDNSQNIWKLTGDVSDNSYNIWNLTGDVSDNSYNIFLLSGDVSNNTTCCLDNSQNIWKLTGDISDNSYNIFRLFGIVNGGNLAGEWTPHAHAGIHYPPNSTDSSAVGIGVVPDAGARLKVEAVHAADTALYVAKGAVKFDATGLGPPTQLPQMLYYNPHTGLIKYGDVSGGAGGGGSGKGGRMLVLGPRCDYSGHYESGGPGGVPWTSFSGPFSGSLRDGEYGTGGYVDHHGDGSGNAMVIGNFPTWSELGGATQFRLTLIGAGGGGAGGDEGKNDDRGGGAGAAEALIDCASETIYNHYFGDPKCELRLATRGQCCPHDTHQPAFAGTEPRYVTNSSGASYLWSADGSGASTYGAFSGYDTSGAPVLDSSQGLQAWLFTQCGADRSTLTQWFDGEGGGGWFDPSWAYSGAETTLPIVRTYLGENQQSFKRLAMNGLGILDANNGARYGGGGIGNGFQGSGGGSALYIEWWPSSGGGSGTDDYATLTKTDGDGGNTSTFPPATPDGSWVNIFASTKTSHAVGEGIYFIGTDHLPAGVDSSGYFNIDNEGKYLISLNLHLTATGSLNDTSCNILIEREPDSGSPGPQPNESDAKQLALVPLGMTAVVAAEGGLEQTITCVKPLGAGDKVTFWLKNFGTGSVSADIGTTANFARIGGGGGNAVVVSGEGYGSVRGVRKGNTARGEYSVAIGKDCSAGGYCSVALGFGADASNGTGFIYRDGGAAVGGHSHTLRFDTSGHLWTDNSNITQEIANHDASLVVLDASMITRAPVNAPVFTGVAYSDTDGPAGKWPSISWPGSNNPHPPPVPEPHDITGAIATTAWVHSYASTLPGAAGLGSSGILRVDYSGLADWGEGPVHNRRDVSWQVLPSYHDHQVGHPVWRGAGDNRTDAIPDNAYVKVTMVGGGGAGGGGGPWHNANAPQVLEALGGGGGGGGAAITLPIMPRHLLDSRTFYVGAGGQAQSAGWGLDSPYKALLVPPHGQDGSGGAGQSTWCNVCSSWRANGGRCGGPGGVDASSVFGATNPWAHPKVTRNGGGGAGGRVTGVGPVGAGNAVHGGSRPGSARCGGGGSNAPRGISDDLPKIGGWGGTSPGGWNCGGAGGIGAATAADGSIISQASTSTAGDGGCVIFEWWSSSLPPPPPA